MLIRRRAALLGLASAISLGGASLAVAAAETQRRLVVLILRGALDGLSAVVPYGDPDLRLWRAELVPPEPGQPGGLFDLGGFFGLHPALERLHLMYAAGDLLPLHAVAGPYRNRSHFEAQDLLECGAEQRMASGWLNRVAGRLPQVGSGATALAVGPSMPLLLRGPTPVGAWAPPALHQPDTEFYARLTALHEGDALTSAALAEGLLERGFTQRVLSGAESAPPAHGGLPRLARAAGRLLAAPGGPRLAALESADGWDTHGNQARRVTNALLVLDEALGELKSGLADAWPQTVVLVMTEFGRTVRINGTGGTDHGTGSAALLLGGAVAGGQMRADWPGLTGRQLFENRDLQPTADLRGVAKGVLAGHFGLDAAGLDDVFPGSAGVAPMAGLLRG